MLNTVRHMLQNLKPRPTDEETLAQEGHRQFVGGKWDQMGKLQLEFLVNHNLKPNHVFLDIACGALRAGRLLIPYLNPGNYMGMDKHLELIEAGKAKELTPEVLRERQPQFVVSDTFEFEKLSKKPDYCIAQSLFSHLRKQEIELCLSKLGAFAKPGCRFYATFCQVAVPIPQLAKSHSVRSFFFTRGTMEAIGKRTGWESTYIGNWNHPDGQMMMEYVKQ